MERVGRKITYSTRDAGGNDIVTEIAIKQFKITGKDFYCAACGEHHTSGVLIKDAVSSSYTDWQLLDSDAVCQRCADFFSLYFYSYIADPDGIHVLNVRELKDRLISEQKTPFLFCITTSRKKHLFYTAQWNYSAERFAVNLERETIYTSPERMREMFDFVECLQTLGASKDALKSGKIPFAVAQKVNSKAFEKLKNELVSSREIQIPLYCGQKREITEEESACIINSILNA